MSEFCRDSLGQHIVALELLQRPWSFYFEAPSAGNPDTGQGLADRSFLHITKTRPMVHRG